MLTAKSIKGPNSMKEWDPEHDSELASICRRLIDNQSMITHEKWKKLSRKFGRTPHGVCTRIYILSEEGIVSKDIKRHYTAPSKEQNLQIAEDLGFQITYSEIEEESDEIGFKKALEIVNKSLVGWLHDNSMETEIIVDYEDKQRPIKIHRIL